MMANRRSEDHCRGSRTVASLAAGGALVVCIALACVQSALINDLRQNISDLDEKLSLIKVDGESNKHRTRRQAYGGCIQGERGRDGRDGRDGLPGPRGLRGSPGESGRQGVTGPPGQSLTAERLNEILRSVLESFHKGGNKLHNSTKVPTVVDMSTGNKSQPVGSAVYIRWGRTSCREGASKVYDGIGGGKYYSHAGGGAELLCLPRRPQWGNYTDGFQSKSYLYGLEYEVSANSPFILRNGQPIHDHEVPCAVCHVADRGHHLMIPALKSCPTGWQHEYNGYLMAGHHSHQTNSFVCVDERPEVEQGSSPNLNGALLYVVEAQCGSLPCPWYRNGRELTCVVCTR